MLWQLRGLCGENRGTGSSERRRGHKLRRARSCCGGAFSCCFAGVSLLRFATHVRSFVQGHTLQCSKARGWDQTRHATAYVCDCPGSLPLLVRVGFHCRSGVVPFVPPARSLSPLSVVVSCVPKPRPRSLCWECRPCPSSPCPLVWALWPLSLLRLASTELGPHVVSSCIGCGGAAAGGSHGTVSWRSSTSSRRMGSPRSLWSSFVAAVRLLLLRGFGNQQGSGEVAGCLSGLARCGLRGVVGGLGSPSLVRSFAAARGCCSPVFCVDAGWHWTAVVLWCCLKRIAPRPRHQVRLALLHEVDDVEHCFLSVVAGEEVGWSPWDARG